MQPVGGRYDETAVAVSQIATRQGLEGDRRVEYPVVQATLTQRYTTRALEFIERNKAHPFFLYFAHAMPHKPLAASEDFYRKTGAGLYADAVAELDWSVGQVFAKLKALGLDENTIVVFTSDNGATFGGSTIEVKNEINQQEYGPHIHVRDILEGKVQPPDNTKRLYDLLDGKR